MRKLMKEGGGALVLSPVPGFSRKDHDRFYHTPSQRDIHIFMAEKAYFSFNGNGFQEVFQKLPPRRTRYFFTLSG